MSRCYPGDGVVHFCLCELAVHGSNNHSSFIGRQYFYSTFYLISNVSFSVSNFLTISLNSNHMLSTTFLMLLWRQCWDTARRTNNFRFISLNCIVFIYLSSSWTLVKRKIELLSRWINRECLNNEKCLLINVIISPYKTILCVTDVKYVTVKRLHSSNILPLTKSSCE